uniref:RING-CH-type domain-containing protein n=1 Tax=Leersia perrieri TaxID=77586 RepID=A0A0D9UW65_9ORYZ
MGDHLALLVDRLLTESTLDAAIRKQVADLQAETVAIDYCCDGGDGGAARKMVECRICQEEDWDTSMEAPCSCCGSLKYAHRKCIQRWCNEKGDTMCEICLQQFKPGYTAPQQLFHYGSIPMNFRGNWEIARQDLHDSQIITMVPSERDFMDGYEDYLPIRTRSSTLCCRTVAIIFMALLVLRHTLPLMIGGNGEYSLALFALLVLRTAGILFPILVMVRALATFHRRRRQQESREMYMTSSDTEEEEEDEEDLDTNYTQPIHSQTRLVPIY